MADLTAITTPFGLLDKETQDALRAHGGPYEAFCVHEDDGRPEWLPQDCYGTPFDFDTHPAIAWRVKPQPPKPREFWVLLDSDREHVRERSPAFNEKAYRLLGWILVREVLE